MTLKLMLAKTRRRRSLLLPVVVALLAICAPAPALAQDFAAAGRHFAAAQDAFAQGSYRKAVQEFQAAYDITQDPVLLFNIGESWQRAGEARKAAQGYRAYLAAQPKASDRPEVERRLRALETAAPPGPGTPAPEAGTPAPGGVPRAAVAPKAPAPSDDLAKRALDERPPNVYRTVAWSGVAVTVALLTAGAILGLGAQNRADELTRRASVVMGGQPPIYDANQRDAYTSLRDDGQSYNTAAITCFALAGVTAVASGVLFLVDLRQKKRSAPDRLTLGGAAGRLAAGWSF